MSETEIRIGKVKEIKFAGGSTFDEKVKILEKLGHEIEEIDKDEPYIYCPTLQMIGDGRIFEIIEDQSYEYDDIAHASKNTDETISYTLKYHNGGTCFVEMLEEAILEMEKKE